MGSVRQGYNRRVLYLYIIVWDGVDTMFLLRLISNS